MKATYQFTLNVFLCQPIRLRLHCQSFAASIFAMLSFYRHILRAETFSMILARAICIE